MSDKRETQPVYRFRADDERAYRRATERKRTVNRRRERAVKVWQQGR